VALPRGRKPELLEGPANLDRAKPLGVLAFGCAVVACSAICRPWYQRHSFPPPTSASGYHVENDGYTFSEFRSMEEAWSGVQAVFWGGYSLALDLLGAGLLAFLLGVAEVAAGTARRVSKAAGLLLLVASCVTFCDFIEHAVTRVVPD